MKRMLRISTLAGTIAAAVCLSTLSSSSEAQQHPLFRAFNGGYVYGGDYPSGNSDYPGYGYSKYGSGAYTYGGARYRTYNYSRGIGTAGTFDYTGHGYSYGGTRFYGQPYRQPYVPFGYGGYAYYGHYGF